MANGVIAELNELIDLRRYVQSIYYRPQGKAIRSGSHLSKLRGRGMDFAEVRNYQAGDEIRHMEWRVTARTGRPHVKIYQEERERPVVILTDFNPSMIFGTRIAFKSVIAARLTALLAWTVIKEGDRVGGVFFQPPITVNLLLAVGTWVCCLCWLLYAGILIRQRSKGRLNHDSLVMLWPVYAASLGLGALSFSSVIFTLWIANVKSI